MAIIARDLPLTIAQKVTATIRGEKYNVSLRGWSVKEYLIVDFPSAPGEQFRVATLNWMHDPVYARGCVYKFQDTDYLRSHPGVNNGSRISARF
ncbi:MAG: hypothetical protein QF607_05230 [Nitrospinaceae bacterium]|nr:hypothetical protein [Nitrospinaceae bacterium]